MFWRNRSISFSAQRASSTFGGGAIFLGLNDQWSVSTVFPLSGFFRSVADGLSASSVLGPNVPSSIHFASTEISSRERRSSLSGGIRSSLCVHLTARISTLSCDRPGRIDGPKSAPCSRFSQRKWPGKIRRNHLPSGSRDTFAPEAAGQNSRRSVPDHSALLVRVCRHQRLEIGRWPKR